MWDDVLHIGTTNDLIKNNETADSKVLLLWESKKTPQRHILFMDKVLHTSWGEGSLPHYLQGFIHPRWLGMGFSEPSTVCPRPRNQVSNKWCQFSTKLPIAPWVVSLAASPLLSLSGAFRISWSWSRRSKSWSDFSDLTTMETHVSLSFSGYNMLYHISWGLNTCIFSMDCWGPRVINSHLYKRFGWEYAD